MTNGNRGSSNEHSESAREESPRQTSENQGSSNQSEREPPREPREPPREQRSEGAQAPLDLPPPPQSKPFVVWSSSPGDAGPGGRRDE